MENIRIEDLYYVLKSACFDNALYTVRDLLDLGLNVDGVDKDGNFLESYHGLPLYIAVEVGAPDLVKLFLERGANPNLNSARHLLPLVKACDYEDEEIARLLLDHGADIDARQDVDEQAAIHAAVYSGSPPIVKLFCERGASLEAVWQEPDFDSHEPKTPLMLAVTRLAYDEDHVSREILEILLGHGANVNATNELGRTALMYAVEHNSAEAVEILLAYGANPWLKDNSGETALDKTQDTRVRVLLHFCHRHNGPHGGCET